MASGRIEQQIDLKVNGLADVKAAEKIVDGLDGTKAKVSIEADATKAQRTVSDVLEDVRKLDAQDAQIVLSLRAAAVEQELTDILQAVAKVDTEKATIDVELARANELRGDLEQLKGAIKEVDATKATVEVDVDTTKARTGVEDLGKSADSSKSVLANMVGNATQDLGALGGVAGSAGVAIGQMGEYMADALSAGDKLGNVIGNFAKIAGPVAGIALFTEVLGKMVAAGKEVGQLNADRATKFFEAIRDGTDALATMREEVEKTGALNFGQAGASMFGIAPGIESVLPLLNKAKIDFQDWARMIQEFPEKGSGYLAQLEGMNLTGGEAEEVLNALIQATAAKQEADQKAAQSSQFLGEQVMSERDAMLAAKEAEGQRTDALDDGARAATDAAREAGKLEGSTMRAEQAARDLGAAWDALSGQLDAEQAIANIGSDFDDMRAKGAEAWDATAKGADDAKAKQDDYAQSVLNAKQNVVDLGKQIGLSVPQVKDMVLRIDSGDIDRVEQELRILTRNRTMNLSIVASGGQGYSTYVPGASNPRSVPQSAPAMVGATQTAAPPVVVPVAIPAPVATTTTVPVAVNIRLQAGVIGSRFEVERAVRRATRDGIRLAGTR